MRGAISPLPLYVFMARCLVKQLIFHEYLKFASCANYFQLLYLLLHHNPSLHRDTCYTAWETRKEGTTFHWSKGIFFTVPPPSKYGSENNSQKDNGLIQITDNLNFL